MTLEALGQAAGRRHQSLFAAAFAAGVENEVKPAALAAVREFCQFINRMEARAQKEPAGQVLEDLLRAIGYEAWLFESLDPREAEGKWGNVRDFVQWLSSKGVEENKNLVELSQTVALISMLDKNEDEQDAVQLATLHAAKGLEFPHVFLVGIEEGVLPHRESMEGGKVEEERRLMYVGITRAQRSLNVTYCERRKQGREIVPREPSRFIVEMGEDIKHSGRDQAPAVTKDEGRAKLAAFRALLAPKA